MGTDFVDGVKCGSHLTPKGTSVGRSEGLRINDHEVRRFQFAHIKLVGELSQVRISI